MRIGCALLALLLPLAALATEPRVARVIGNAAYKDMPLANPVNDARALALSLRAAGFEVTELHDAGGLRMRRAIREFGERLRQNGAGVFYFAGHGVQIRGRNFLVPVDADVRYEDEVEDQSIDVALVLGKMESAKARVNLLILDACRNNPFTRNTRSLQNGLAPMEAPIGTLIAFATSPGQVASDGAGGHGLYTEHLVREMSQRGMKVEDVFKRVRAAVRAASSGRQVPWENTSLEGDFYFHQPEVIDTAAVERERRRAQEEAVQAAVREALKTSRAEAERERVRLEQTFAERLEKERDAMRKEAMERLAALEKSALVATPATQRLALESPRPAQSTAPVGAAKPMPSPEPIPPAEEKSAVKEEEPQINELPPGLLIALGADPQKRNRVKEVSEEAARGLAPSRPRPGDSWIYFREIRDGQGTTRRNYVTLTAAEVQDNGYTIVHSDASTPSRFDADGNRLAAPYGPPHQAGASLAFEPADPMFRFPLAPGSSWSGSIREESRSLSVRAETEVKVVGWEELKVPAGSFKAVKVAQIQSRAWEPFPGQRQRSRRVTNVWYVPAVRNIARMETFEVTTTGSIVYDQVWELDSFEIN